MKQQDHRAALIVSCGTYEDETFNPLPATTADVAGLKAALLDQATAAFSDVTVVKDCSKVEVELAIQKFLRNTPSDGLLLLYFTGHGIRDIDGKFYIVARDSQSDYLASTAISAEFVATQFHQCVQSRRLMFLDCCYAGAFPSGMTPRAGATINVIEQLEGSNTIRSGKGYAIVTATDRQGLAYETGGQLTVDPSELEPSIFTKYVIEALETGDAAKDESEYVGLQDLFQYVRQKVVADRPGQRPQMKAEIEDDIIIARARPQRGENAHLTMDIPEALARHGGPHPVELPNGKVQHVQIPANATEGMKLLPEAGLGKRGKHGGPAGDLVITLKIVAPEPVQGLNDFRETWISVDEARVGCTKTVQSLRGDVTVAIPAGTVDGKDVSLPEMGELGYNGGKSGNLVVTVRVTPEAPQVGADFRHTAAIGPADAYNGCEIEIDTPSRIGYKFRVPKGTTAKTELGPVAGLGHPGKNGGSPGNLFVKFRIDLDIGRGADYRANIELSEEEARNGATKVLDGPWGSFEFGVPGGSTTSEYVIPGQGAHGDFGANPGNLIIKCLVVTTPPPVVVEPSKPEEAPVVKTVTPPVKASLTTPVAAKKSAEPSRPSQPSQPVKKQLSAVTIVLILVCGLMVGLRLLFIIVDSIGRAEEQRHKEQLIDSVMKNAPPFKDSSSSGGGD